MIDDEHLRVLHTAAGGVVEALAVGRTGPPHAVARVTPDLVPDAVGGERGQVGERAVGRLPGPGSNLDQLGPLAIVIEKTRGPLERQP